MLLLPWLPHPLPHTPVGSRAEYPAFCQFNICRVETLHACAGCSRPSRRTARWMQGTAARVTLGCCPSSTTTPCRCCYHVLSLNRHIRRGQVPPSCHAYLMYLCASATLHADRTLSTAACVEHGITFISRCCSAVLLPGRDAQVPLPPVLAAGCDAAHRLGLQYGGASVPAAQGPHGDRTPTKATKSQVAERLVASLTGFWLRDTSRQHKPRTGSSYHRRVNSAR